MRIGIDLLWVRPGICGGTEAYIRNLLDGFVTYDDKNEYTLFVSRDNGDTFRHYENSPHMKLCVCPVNSAKQPIRILWENLYLDKWARANGVERMFIPVYSKPRSNGKIPYVTVIHDLQALHYPEYFSFIRRAFLRRAWKYTCKSAEKVITISEYCRQDLIQNYPLVAKKCMTIYNPIIATDDLADFKELADRYHITSGEYFYCVSSLLSHKNMETLFKAMSRWEGPEKLVLSGVGQNAEKLQALLEQYEVADKVIPTGFVHPGERDCLYEHCKVFLFPSVFEGFGMPPIEAMRKGKRVVMTDKTCLEEVTQGKAIYVKEPFSVEEWLERMQYALTLPEQVEAFPQYEQENITRAYMALWV